MRKSIQRYADVAVAHNLLKGFGIHPRGRHPAEGMAAHMGRYFGHLDFVNAVVLLADMLEIFFPVHGNHWHLILIQKQKSGIPINHWLCPGLFSGL